MINKCGVQKLYILCVTIRYVFGSWLLVQVYAFLYFEDWRQDTCSKLFVRDHLLYIDELKYVSACAANDIIERARNNQSKNIVGIFDSMQIRLGDFQYKGTRIEAETIVEA